MCVQACRCGKHGERYRTRSRAWERGGWLTIGVRVAVAAAGAAAARAIRFVTVSSTRRYLAAIRLHSEGGQMWRYGPAAAASALGSPKVGSPSHVRCVPGGSGA